MIQDDSTKDFHDKAKEYLADIIGRCVEKGRSGVIAIDIFSAAYKKHRKDYGSFKPLMMNGNWGVYDQAMTRRLLYQVAQTCRYVNNGESPDVIFKDLRE